EQQRLAPLLALAGIGSVAQIRLAFPVVIVEIEILQTQGNLALVEEGGTLGGLAGQNESHGQWQCSVLHVSLHIGQCICVGRCGVSWSNRQRADFWFGCVSTAVLRVPLAPVTRRKSGGLLPDGAQAAGHHRRPVSGAGCRRGSRACNVLEPAVRGR